MQDPTTVTGQSGTGQVERSAAGPALRLALTGLAGASIEWYDFFLYATASAMVFPTVFFPASMPPAVALIASFSTFAVGFIARPVGAVWFGHIGDRVGRKTAFAYALIAMGTATTLIGILPTYQTAGAFSPIALVALRIVQGLAAAGQWGGAALLATESAPAARRGLYGSLAQAGVPVGVLLANLALLAASASTSPGAFMDYGWRVPFLLSVVLVALGVYVLRSVEDTDAYTRLKAQASKVRDARAARPSPVVEALRLYPRLIFVAAGAYISTVVAFYMLITYIVAYGTSPAGLGLPRTTMLAVGLVGSVTTVPMTFLAGALSDRYGRKRVFMTGVALMSVWAFAMFPLLATKSLPLMLLAVIVGAALDALPAGPLAAMFAEQFATHVRYSAATLAYQIAAIVGGALTPIIATALYAHYHSNVPVSAYIACSCVISFVCAALLAETRATTLPAGPADDTAVPLTTPLPQPEVA